MPDDIDNTKLETECAAGSVGGSTGGPDADRAQGADRLDATSSQEAKILLFIAEGAWKEQAEQEAESIEELKAVRFLVGGYLADIKSLNAKEIRRKKEDSSYKPAFRRWKPMKELYDRLCGMSGAFWRSRRRLTASWIDDLVPDWEQSLD